MMRHRDSFFSRITHHVISFSRVSVTSVVKPVMAWFGRFAGFALSSYFVSRFHVSTFSPLHRLCCADERAGEQAPRCRLQPSLPSGPVGVQPNGIAGDVRRRVGPP